ncbi:MAG: hypothetical protein WD942_02910 [Dehalococcoidia bacterium]
MDVSEIEDAGIREVLQTPGAAYGAWSILDALLAPTGAGTPFIFRQPLGQAREVKVALSGLFGRFVARAYQPRISASILELFVEDTQVDEVVGRVCAIIAGEFE